jgi:predicted Zn-dependent protease
METEADHIGIMLLADAGFDPRIAPTFYEKLGEISGNSLEKEEYKSTHPSSKTRSRLLSEANVMDKAVAVYAEANCKKETEGFFIFSSEKVSFS